MSGQQIAVIQGASRGIGLALALRLSTTVMVPPVHVIATGRSRQRFIDSLTQLSGLGTPVSASASAILSTCTQTHNQMPCPLTFMEVDTTDESSVQAMAETMRQTHGANPIRLFVYAAGMLDRPEKSLRGLTRENAIKHFETNVVGAMLSAKYFSDMLVKSRPKTSSSSSSSSTTMVKGQPLLPQIPVWANISARTGSIGDNHLGGWYSYRISKAALNQLTRTMSIELARRGDVAVVSLHPGTVDTALSRPHVRATTSPSSSQHKVMSPDTCADALISVMSKLSVTDNGTFLDYKGTPIPW